MPYRFAILGCGNIAGRHAAAISNVGTLSAVCDIDPARARGLALNYGSKPYTSHPDMLENEYPDLVSVCTPSGLHAQHVIACLKAGCHVLCEKPLAISVSDGSRMINEALINNKKLFVVKQNRFNPPVLAIKKLLDEGKLGTINSFQLNCFWNRPSPYYKDSWRGTLALDGGTLFTQFSHFIDLLYWFLGEIDDVKGWRGNFTHKGIIEFEDTGVANLIMKNGSIGSIQYTINSYFSNMEGSFTLFGEKGTVKIGGQYLNRIDHFSVENEKNPECIEGNGANSYGYYNGSKNNHMLVYEELVRSLHNPDHSLVEAGEALRSIEMISQIYAASPFVHANQTV